MLKHFTLALCLTVPGGEVETWEVAASSTSFVKAPTFPPTLGVAAQWWNLHCYLSTGLLKEKAK